MENPNLLNFYNKSLHLITPNVTQSISIGGPRPFPVATLIDATRIQASEMVDSVSLSNGFLKSGSYVSGSAGWKIDANGDVEFNDGNFRGDITGATGTFSGTITGGSLNIPDTTTANSFHVDSDGNAWWGAVAIGDATAKVLKTGVATFTKVTISGGSDVSFVSDTIDTTNKTILKDFTFGSADYSGAFKSGDITWNTTTGTVTGGSGVLINKGGIIGATAGVTTFSINATTGDVILAGTVTATAGAIGGFSLGSDYIRDTANSFGLAATVTAGDDVRFWAGETFANRASAPFYVTESGEVGASDIIIKGGATGYKIGSGTFLGYDESEELEQWYTPTSNLGDYLWGDNTTNKVGQGFSITDGQTNISSIHVWLKMKTAAQTSNTITCDLYLLDTSTLLPTGASLGQASIAGIDNTDYEEKTFTFSSPITINSSNLYVFVLDTSYTSGDGIYLEHVSSSSDYKSGELVRYTSSWATVVKQDALFEVYSKYSENKLYVGNSTYSLTFNSAFIDATERFIVRDSDTSDTFAKYEDDGLSFISSGQTIFSISSNGSITSRIAKGLSAGYLNVYTISSTGAAANDVLNDGSGFRVTENKGSATMTFSNQGLVVTNGVFATIGSAASKQTVYCNALSACPLPSTDNALAKFKTLPEPKTKDKLHKPEKAHFEFKEPGKKRKYFDIDDVPDEVTFINSDGEKDIELIRVIGFCFQALKELNEEVETLKKRLNK